MNKLRSEVLFNRALLWLVLSNIAIHYTGSKVIAGSYLMVAAYNVVKSMHVWSEDE